MKFKTVSLVLALASILAMGAAYAKPPGLAGSNCLGQENHHGNGYGHIKRKNFGPD